MGTRKQLERKTIDKSKTINAKKIPRKFTIKERILNYHS